MIINNIKDMYQPLNIEVSSDKNIIDSKNKIIIYPIYHKKINSSKYKNFKEIPILSKLFFYWSTIAMKISNKEPLKQRHLLNYLKLTDTQDELQYLKELWFGNNETSGYNKYNFCPILLVILRANLKNIIFLLLLQLFHLICRTSQIYFKRELILSFKYLKSNDINDKPDYELSITVFLFIIIKISLVLFSNHLKYLENCLGDKTGIQINSFIYEKNMTSAPSNSYKISEGDIMNYIQVDSESLGLFFYYLPKTILFPFQFFLYIYMLFDFFGWTFIISFVILIILLCISFVLQYFYIKQQFTYLSNKDERVNFTNETFRNIKFLKLYNWEENFMDLIFRYRNKEILTLKKILNLEVICSLIHWAIPIILSIISLGVYTHVNGKLMNIADLMTSIEIYDSMTGPLSKLPLYMKSQINAFISMTRITKYLKLSDQEPYYNSDRDELNSIKINNVNFGNRYKNEILLKNINLTIKKGEFVAIIGETGSGKSLFIKSLLGAIEKIYENQKINITNNDLIINGSLSYASQVPFIINESIKNNILFFKEYNEERYMKSIELCQLKIDINNLVGGDLTEIGTNGTNISGGQKARINLARAAYVDSDIYLFDDPISACDTYVSKEIFNNLFVNYLKDKTRLVVTNDFRFLDKYDRIIFIEKSSIKFIGEYNNLKNQKFFLDLIETKNNNISDLNENINENKINNIIDNYNTNNKNYNLPINNMNNSSEKEHLKIYTEFKNKEIKKKAKLIKSEDKNKGKIGLEVYKKFIYYLGGYILVFCIIFFAIAWQVSKVLGNLFLTDWSENQTEYKDNLHNFLIYCKLGIGTLFFVFLKDFLISRSTLKLNNILHNSMIVKLIKAPINLFHDIFPIGMILNRLTFDLEKAKEVIQTYSSFLKSICTLIGAIIVCIKYNKLCLILSPLLIFIGFYLTNYCINAARDLNRLESISRSPILSLYSETVLGLYTIKTFQVEENFKEKFFDNLDVYYSIINFKYGSESYFDLSFDLNTIAYISFILIYAIIFKNFFSAKSISLLVKYSISFSDEILNSINFIINIEKSMISIERCDNFTKIKSENYEINKSIDNNLIKKNWPKKGNIKFENVNIRYRPHLDLTLKNISFSINNNEKIGIVGRTGSGKSTLSLTLFRIIELEKGNIIIDGVDISKIGLKILRSNITIIPQEPILFKGSLRFNLDPLYKYTDNEIKNAIDEVGLFQLMRENGKNIQDELNLFIKENGNNLSLGEKQLICFARAILRKNKIIIFDEATASLDHKTEEFVSKKIEEIFKNNTLLIIAHRIETLNKCDKIIVIDSGEIKEVDTIENLLKIKNGYFLNLYSNLKK